MPLFGLQEPLPTAYLDVLDFRSADIWVHPGLTAHAMGLPLLVCASDCTC